MVADLGKVENDADISELYISLFTNLLNTREEQQGAVVKKQLEYYREVIRLFYDRLVVIETGKSNKTARLLKFLESSLTKYDSLINDIEDTFMLFTVGTGNYGKSTLINALLETEAAETDVLPKTWKIDVFSGKVPFGKANIVYRDNTRKQVSTQKAKALLNEEERKKKEQDKIITAKLKTLKKEVSSFEVFKDYKLKLEREESYESPIVEVHWGMASVPILKNFRIVDTPGLTQNVMGEVRNSVNEYYHKADGVLWMLDATSIAAQNTKQLVKDLEESLAKVGGKQNRNIIAVLNRIDLIFANQGEEGVKRVVEDATKIFGGYFRKIIPFSAKNAYEGKIKNDSLLMEKSGLNQLNKEIEETFLKNAKRIQVEKKLQSGKVYNKEVSTMLTEYLSELEGNIEKFQNVEEKFYTQLVRTTKNMSKTADSKIEVYKKRVIDNIRLKSDSFIDVKDADEQKRIADQEIFESQYLTRLLKAYQANENKAFTDIAMLYQNKIYFTEYPNLTRENLPSIQAEISAGMEISRDSFGEDMVTYGSGVAIGLIATVFLGPLGPLVGWGASIFAKNSLKDSIRRKLYEKLDEITEELEEKIKDNLDIHEAHAYDMVLANAISSFNEVYGSILTNQELDQQEDEASKFDNLVEDVLELIDFGFDIIGLLGKDTPSYYTPVKQLLLEKGV